MAIHRRFALDMLANNLFMIGQKLTKQVATWNPSNNKWTSIKNNNKADYNSEEGYVQLPNGTILTADVKNSPNSEIFNPSTNKWTSAGSTVVDLRSQSPFHQCLPYGPKPKDCYLPPGEIGPAVLLPNGTVFATGSGKMEAATAKGIPPFTPSRAVRGRPAPTFQTATTPATRGQR